MKKLALYFLSILVGSAVLMGTSDLALAGPSAEKSPIKIQLKFFKYSEKGKKIYFDQKEPIYYEYKKPIGMEIEVRNVSGGSININEEFTSTNFYNRMWIENLEKHRRPRKLRLKHHGFHDEFPDAPPEPYKYRIVNGKRVRVVICEVLKENWSKEFPTDDLREYYPIGRHGNYSARVRVPAAIFKSNHFETEEDKDKNKKLGFIEYDKAEAKVVVLTSDVVHFRILEPDEEKWGEKSGLEKRQETQVANDERPREAVIQARLEKGHKVDWMESENIDISKDIIFQDGSQAENAHYSIDIPITAPGILGVMPLSPVLPLIILATIQNINCNSLRAPQFEVPIPDLRDDSVPIDTNIEIEIACVERDTIFMYVDGVLVNPTITSIDRKEKRWNVFYDPLDDFMFCERVNWRVEAAYVKGGYVNQQYRDYSFTIQGPLAIDDSDGDCITNIVETTVVKTNPTKKTLFVRPLKESSNGGEYEYWNVFTDSNPPVLPPFNYNAVFATAYKDGINVELVIIGDPNNPYYDPNDPYSKSSMRNFLYDPATDPNKFPCDILNIIRRPDSEDYFCTYSGRNFNCGYIHFIVNDLGWSWDTKGYVPYSEATTQYMEHWYFTPRIYHFAVKNYIRNLPYTEISVGKSPGRGTVEPGCNQYYVFAPGKKSALNHDGNDTVEFNTIASDEWAEIIEPEPTFGSEEFVEYQVIRRTVVHEIGHALMGAESEHCISPPGQPNFCVMNEPTKDFILHGFGSIPQCTHSVNINSDVHNSVHK